MKYKLYGGYNNFITIHLSKYFREIPEESINSLSQSIETLKQNEETLKERRPKIWQLQKPTPKQYGP